ncbi:hypothetical protein SLEP1_g32020 [Rubroshorea leprosula]|uniref:Uncharacterized protein n=1 Tax=Rubroshorea leprosula TaxID=152421 RepID=A0AAV5KBZ8_9ROSI|nr:hypothetical protein SLEP1_g32020 [Rubroshorea leprosula]
MRSLESSTPYPYLIAGLAITANQKFSHYLETEPTAAATMIFRGSKVGVNPAHVVASFSARGPNIIAVNVLKPDLIAPGVNILAAWPNLSPSKLPEDPRRTKFNIISGNFDGERFGQAAKMFTPGAIKSGFKTFTAMILGPRAEKLATTCAS